MRILRYGRGTAHQSERFKTLSKSEQRKAVKAAIRKKTHHPNAARGLNR